MITDISLLWRHNGHDGVSNHQPHDCLLNRLFWCRSKKTPKLRVTGLCAGNSPGTSNAENIPIGWRRHVKIYDVVTYAWASCQIRKIAGAHAPGMPGTFSPSPQVSDPDMHHGTCVTHVPWCMPGSLTSCFLWNRRRGKTFPAFPAHAQPAILRIW